MQVALLESLAAYRKPAEDVGPAWTKPPQMAQRLDGAECWARSLSGLCISRFTVGRVPFALIRAPEPHCRIGMHRAVLSARGKAGKAWRLVEGASKHHGVLNGDGCSLA
jgi:hypothetical protein